MSTLRETELDDAGLFGLRVLRSDTIAYLYLLRYFAKVDEGGSMEAHPIHVEHMGLSVTSIPACAACSASHCCEMILCMQLIKLGPVAYQATCCHGTMHTSPADAVATRRFA